jgi:hypothetical protein
LTNSRADYRPDLRKTQFASEPQIHSRLGTMYLSTGKDVFHGIRQGYEDAAHDVKQAVVGGDVEVSLGERHPKTPTATIRLLK